jgi:hypothetical protein
MEAPYGYTEPTFGQRVLARLMDTVLLLPPFALIGLVVDGAGDSS